MLLKNNLKCRYESFGGIIWSDDPLALLYVDKDFMRSLGHNNSLLWKKRQRKYLSAPLEADLSLTNQCPFRCQACCAGAGEKIEGELNTEEWKRALRMLAKMGVFCIPFGGGECFGRNDVWELAEYCRELGMVPNATTNGYYITRKTAEKCRVFGRINVSLDGVGRKYAEIRGVDGFETADKAIQLLVEAGNTVGINCIICQKNFGDLKEIIRYAQERKIKDITFLRFKPTGRAAKYYQEMKLTQEQNKELIPSLLKLQEESTVVFQTGCSFVPMVCYHRPSPETLHFFSVEGCAAGDVSIGILPDGRYDACGLCQDTGGKIFDLPQDWNKSPDLKKFREWTKHAKEPCKSCEYLNYCKGGCHAIAEFVTGDFSNPDPDCPFLVEYNRSPEKGLRKVRSPLFTRINFGRRQES